MRRITSAWVAGYGAATLLVGLAWLGALALLGAADRVASLLFLAAVALSSWYGGLGPGLLATVLGAVASVVARRPLAPLSLEWSDGLPLAVYVLVAMLINSLHAKQAQDEQAVRESEAGRAAIIHAALDGIINVDAAGRIVEFNPAAEAMFGRRRAEVVGTRVTDLLRLPNWPGTDPPRLAHYLVAEGAGILNRRVETLARRPTGVEFPIELAITRAPVSGPPTFTAFVRDITERREADTALRDTNARLTRLVGDTEQQARQIAWLGELGELLQSSVTLEEVYAVVTRLVPGLFPGGLGFVGILDAEKVVEVSARWGISPSPETRFPVTDCWALRRGRLHVFHRSGSGPACGHVQGAPVADTLCVPIMAHGTPLGVLHLEWQRPRDAPVSSGVPTASHDTTIQVAQGAAAHIGLAVAGLKLQGLLREQAIRDPLTTLFNRRYMEEALEREIRRAARTETPVAVLMLDLDRFKQFNDTAGHLAGDALLRTIGRFLTSCVRGEDVACRFGGDEFLLILPGTPLEVACQRGEQLLREAQYLTASGRGMPEAITLSLGIGAFPAHGTTAEAVLRATDDALTRAKREGRNRAVVADVPPASRRTLPAVEPIQH